MVQRIVRIRTWLNLGNSGTEQDFADSLTGSLRRNWAFNYRAESQTLYNNGSEWSTSNYQMMVLMWE